MNIEELSTRLGEVTEPDLCDSLANLDMISKVAKVGGRYRVTLYTYPAVEGYFDPVADRLEEVARSFGVALEIEARAMNDEQLSALALKVSKDIEGSPERQNRLMVPGTSIRILGFSSGKGGVGKSSTTVGVAVALAKAGYRVGILDADVYGFSIPKMLGIVRAPSLIGKLMVPPVSFGIKTMSVGYFVSDDTPVIWRGPMLHKALEQFLFDVGWGELDFLCVDLPPGTGDVTLSVAEYLPKVETYVVTTPQEAAERVAQRSALAAKKLKLPLRGVIENMSYFVGNDGVQYEIFGSGGGERLAKSLGIELLGKIPLDVELRSGGDIGKPIGVVAPDSSSAIAFDQIAAQIVKLGPARIYKKELRVR